jgi:hypothetical protein
MQATHFGPLVAVSVTVCAAADRAIVAAQPASGSGRLEGIVVRQDERARMRALAEDWIRRFRGDALTLLVIDANPDVRP